MIPGTPYLVVDLERVRANIDRAARWAQSRGVGLRPHVKTHKIPELARLQLEAGAVGIAVATIGEAEVFVDAGFHDVFIAYPLWLDEDKQRRLAALSARAALTVGCDSLAAGERLPRGVAVLVEVDSGHHRTGVAPTHAGQLAAQLVAAGVGVRGVFTFPGHSYAPDGRWQAAVDEATALSTAAAALRAEGVDPAVISGGSTPSLALSGDVASEYRPGVYVLNDAQQWELGSCGPDQIALSCHATVVSLAGGRVILDAGSKVLGADRAGYASGGGRLLDHPDARVVQLSEHHAVVTGMGEVALGSVVRIVPNHVCNAMNVADRVFLAVGKQLTGESWKVAARGRNS